MYGLLLEELRQREAAGQPVRVGLVGTGQMGTDIVAQVTRMQGVRVVVTCDRLLNRAVDAYRIAGVQGDPIVAETVNQVADAIRMGVPVACGDFRLVCEAPGVDVVIDATGNPQVGALTALLSARAGKHVVMMTVETDVVVGPLLHWFARRRGVVYTLAAGDEPAAIMELYGFARLLGFEVVAAGKGKNNPLDPYAVPRDWTAEAQRRGLTPEMLVEFVDGSKTNIEMAAVSNATGLIPDRRGMNGPRTALADLTKVFSLREEGGVLSSKGVVDYAIGDIAPGVFLVVETQHPRLQQCMVLRDMGCGPRYLLYRPFHLCSIETPVSAAIAAVYGKPLMAPGSRLVSDVVAVAKKDLIPGERLERIGGETHLGVIERHELARAEQMLPAPLAEGATVTRPVARGEVIRYSDVSLPDTPLVTLRGLQDRWEAGEIAEEALAADLERLVASA